VNRRKIRVLIGTPAGGGEVNLGYLLSMMDVYQNVTQIKHQIFIRDNLRVAKEQGVIGEHQLNMWVELEKQNLIEMEIGLYTLSNESLLSRGRNHIAAVAIRGGWDKLMFIDADSKFSFRQFWEIATSIHDLACGVVPLKTLPIALNFLPFKDDEFYFRDRIRSMDSLIRMREGHKAPWIPVAFAGTAFMCISRKLLISAAERSEEYQYPNPATGFLHTHWNMFDTRPMHGKFMSEDWSFCYRARDLGYKVHINADVVISHVGTMVYTPEMGLPGPMPPTQGVYSSKLDDHPKLEREMNA